MNNMNNTAYISTSKYGLTIMQTKRNNEAAQDAARKSGLRFCYQIWMSNMGILDLETGEQFVVEPDQLGWQYKQLMFKARRGLKIELGPAEGEA